MIDEKDLPAGWWIDKPESMAFLARQLQDEAPAGHSLKGKPLEAVARADGSDDVLYQDTDGRIFAVHLTWSETNQPGYPAYSEFATLAEFKTWWESETGDDL